MFPGNILFVVRTTAFYACVAVLPVGFPGFVVAFWSCSACVPVGAPHRELLHRYFCSTVPRFSVPCHCRPPLLRFLVGVEDVETGELTLHEAGHAYALRQSVGGRQDNVEDHALENLDWKQRRDALVNQFGSKKKKASIRWRIGRITYSKLIPRATGEGGG